MKKALVIIGAAEYNRGSEILLIGILDILIEFGDYKSDISAFAFPGRHRIVLYGTKFAIMLVFDWRREHWGGS